MTNVKAQPPRNTLKNLIMLVSTGQLITILKVLRRRFINGSRYVLSKISKLHSPISKHPKVINYLQTRRLDKILKSYFLYDKNDLVSAVTKIAIIARDGNTYPKSSAFIRLISPLTDPSLKNKIAIKMYPENTTKIGAEYSVCIVQRNALDSQKDAKELIDNLIINGTKLVIDTDDAFAAIDASHPEHIDHSNRSEAFGELTRRADKIWVSTSSLKKQFRDNKKVVVIQNSLDKRLWQTNKKPKTINDKKIKMIYMGTVSHEYDLAMIMPALKILNTKYPGSFSLTIVGVSGEEYNQDWIIKKYQPRGESIYPKFVKWFIEDEAFDVGLSPLVDSEFNQNKSDIKCLDYIAAGITPVVSDITPYQSPEISEYILKAKNTTESWVETLSSIVENPPEFRVKRLPKIQASQKYLWSKRSSGITAKKIADEINDLIK